MAVQAGWVGTSAKGETGEAWMSEARLELRLPKAGWMSEMVGKSKEIRFINTVNRTAANIHTLMGSPTEVGVYIFENEATISAATNNNSSGTAGGWALQTGTFPAGSTLTIINRGAIRGGGGNGGDGYSTGGAGGTALILNFPATIDNTTGTIWGGGGGGGGTIHSFDDTSRLGGGGAGIPGGYGYGGRATATNGRAGEGTDGGAGGGPGAAGVSGGKGAGGWVQRAGGRGGYSAQRNGHAVTWIAVGDRRGSVV